MPDVPYDPDRGEHHRDAEDLSHEGLGRAAEEHDAQGGADEKRGRSGMAQLAVFQPSRQLDGDRGQRADGPREDRRDSEEEDEGRYPVLAASDPEEAGHDPEGEAEDEGEADGGQIERQRSARADLEQNESKARGDQDAREEALENPRREKIGRA